MKGPFQMDDNFTLRNDPPRPMPARFENQQRRHQRMLLTGLDCLPGQEDLFAVDGEPEPPRGDLEILSARQQLDAADVLQAAEYDELAGRWCYEGACVFQWWARAYGLPPGSFARWQAALIASTLDAMG